MSSLPIMQPNVNMRKQLLPVAWGTMLLKCVSFFDGGSYAAAVSRAHHCMLRLFNAPSWHIMMVSEYALT